MDSKNESRFTKGDLVIVLFFTNMAAVAYLGSYFGILMAFAAVGIYLIHVLMQGDILLTRKLTKRHNETCGNEVKDLPLDLRPIMSQVTNPTRYLFRQALVSFIAIIAAIVAYNTIAVETGHHLLVVLGTMMVVEFVLRQEIKTTKHPAPKLQSFFAIIGCAAGYWLGQQMNYPTAGFFVGMCLGGVVVKIFLKSYFVRRLDQANC